MVTMLIKDSHFHLSPGTGKGSDFKSNKQNPTLAFAAWIFLTTLSNLQRDIDGTSIQLIDCQRHELCTRLSQPRDGNWNVLCILTQGIEDINLHGHSLLHI